MKTLESFLKKNLPMRRKSKLAEFKNEIFELYSRGFKVEQIQEFLIDNGVKKISKQAIYDFLNKNKNGEQSQSIKKIENNNEKEIKHEEVSNPSSMKELREQFKKRFN